MKRAMSLRAVTMLAAALATCVGGPVAKTALADPVVHSLGRTSRLYRGGAAASEHSTPAPTGSSRTIAPAADETTSPTARLTQTGPRRMLEEEATGGPRQESRASSIDARNQAAGAANLGSDTNPRQESRDDDEAARGDPFDAKMRGLEPMLGDWLHEQGGLSAEYIYVGDVFNNARGGLSTAGATKYRGDLDIVLRLDTERSKLWEGGEVFVYFFQTHGRTLSAQFVGDAQLYDSLDTSPLAADQTKLGEYWYRQALGDTGLTVKIGFQDSNADYAFADLAGDFINSSFTTLPNVPLPTWPFQRVGMSVFWDPAEWFHFGFGTFDAGANQRQFWFNPVGGIGQFSIAQFDFMPGAGNEDALATNIRLGGWFDSSDVITLTGDMTRPHNYGFYATVDRVLFVEGQDREQGLGVFFEYSWAPQSINGIGAYYGTGVTYRGLVPNRDTDLLGVGMARIDFSDVLTEQYGMTYEASTEVFYRMEVTKSVAFQPDMQYIANPFGNGRDALVVGFRFLSVF